MPRFPSSTDADGVTLDGQVMSLREAVPATDAAADEFVQYLDGAIAHAAESGERLIAEKGDSASPSEPSCQVASDAPAVADVVASWGVEPWDVVVTFWRPSEPSAG